MCVSSLIYTMLFYQYTGPGKETVECFRAGQAQVFGTVVLLASEGENILRITCEETVTYKASCAHLQECNMQRLHQIRILFSCIV